MGVNRLTGSPWHKERVHRAEGDERRYKGRCEHYQYEGDRCSYRSGKCVGSAHCSKYRALSEEEFKEKQKRTHSSPARKKKEEEEVYWYD